MSSTYELLPKIAEINPSITHFQLRLYKHTIGQGIESFKVDSEYHTVSITDLEKVASIIQSFEDKGWMVGLTSKVITTSGTQHLLMLDFSIPISKESENQIIEKMEIFNKSGDISYKLDGYLIQTTNSYHYLGKHITGEHNFIHFLGSSLLFRHADQSYFVVDDRWLGYSLKRNFGTIRIGRKNGNIPLVIKELR